MAATTHAVPWRIRHARIAVPVYAVLTAAAVLILVYALVRR